MNAWQYSRWIYLIGRSIKNKSLQSSQREAFIVFIDEILKTRPSIINRINLKIGNNNLDWKKQNDYSLGKMIQIIGRDLKVLFLTQYQKTLCDKFFFSTDKRRYMSYNEYQALDGKNVYVQENQNLNEIINNCVPNSVIILTENNYETDLNISVPGTKITSENNATLKGNIVITTNDVIIENIIIDSDNSLSFNSEQKMENISINNVVVNTNVEINSDISGFNITNTIINSTQGIVFNGESDNLSISDCEINGTIVFNNSLSKVTIQNNQISSQDGIILNGENKGNVILENNEFNWEK